MEIRGALRDVLLACRVVAFTGMGKNTGKTTALNCMMRLLPENTLGITSVGRDGEDTDCVTGTKKPRVFVKEGTLVATARDLLLKSDVTPEILSGTGIPTPVGEVVVARSLSAGFMEIAGPSIASRISEVCAAMEEFGARPVFLDGALSRKTFAVPQVADACFLCTGAAVCTDAAALAGQTLAALRLLTIPQADGPTASLFDDLMREAAVAFVYDGRVEKSAARLSLGAADTVKRRAGTGVRRVFLRGPVTDRFLTEVLDSPFQPAQTPFVVEDGTRLFLSPGVLGRFLAKGGSFFARRTIRVLGVSVNPLAPDGGTLDFPLFCAMLEAQRRIPVFNVKDFGLDVIE